MAILAKQESLPNRRSVYVVYNPTVGVSMFEPYPYGVYGRLRPSIKYLLATLMLLKECIWFDLI